MYRNVFCCFHKGDIKLIPASKTLLLIGWMQRLVKTEFSSSATIHKIHSASYHFMLRSFVFTQCINKVTSQTYSKVPKYFLLTHFNHIIISQTSSKSLLLGKSILLKLYAVIMNLMLCFLATVLIGNSFTVNATWFYINLHQISNTNLYPSQQNHSILYFKNTINYEVTMNLLLINFHLNLYNSKIRRKRLYLICIFYLICLFCL